MTVMVEDCMWPVEGKSNVQGLCLAGSSFKYKFNWPNHILGLIEYFPKTFLLQIS
jgi:hypothetical protein